LLEISATILLNNIEIFYYFQALLILTYFQNSPVNCIPDAVPKPSPDASPDGAPSPGPDGKPSTGPGSNTGQLISLSRLR